MPVGESEIIVSLSPVKIIFEKNTTLETILVIGRGGLWGYKKARLPHFLDNWPTGGC
jgi:hypothetical protein